MNWESSILNRIYRTNEFKINVTNINNLKDKSFYIKKLKEFIEIHKLYELNIFLNNNAALYKLKPNKKTLYFSYTLNFYFYLYASLFEKGRSYIDLSKINLANFYKDLLSDESYATLYSEKLKVFLFDFLFSQEYQEENSLDLIKSFYEKLNNFFKHKTYLIGNQISYFDIILFSIFFNFKNNTEKFIDLFSNLENYLKSELSKDCRYKHIQRWIFTIKAYCELK